VCHPKSQLEPDVLSPDLEFEDKRDRVKYQRRSFSTKWKTRRLILPMCPRALPPCCLWLKNGEFQTTSKGKMPLAVRRNLESLVQAVDGKIYEVLGDWLANNARNEKLPKEYFVLTSFYMAVESAKVELENRRTPLKPTGDEAKRLDALTESLRKHLFNSGKQ